MATYITRLRDSGPGLAVAVKDLIDMVGVPTTAGCRALERRGIPAATDAACLREIRRREAAGELWIVGKTNLHELAYGVTGINPWFGTPRNPLDPTLMPGGSSSGSAVAVADGDADVALGSDTGGSVRIPAACCGIAGLKTTWGRVALSGVWPLAPSLDTIGPMARDVAGLVTGMRLFEPSFRIGGDATGVEVGLLGVEADPVITAAVDDALLRAELPVRPVSLPSWHDAWAAADVLLSAEAWRADRELLQSDPEGVGEVTTSRIVAGADITVDQELAARRTQLEWQAEMDAALDLTPLIVLPTLVEFPPRIEAGIFRANRWTLPVNFAGLPALSIPVPSAGPLPASLQLIGPAYGEELLLTVGARIEDAVRQG
jgi:amidase